jgi:hypothetical protein
LIRYLPHLAVGLALAGGVYWVSAQRYDAGYLAGDKAGYLRGARDAHKLNDAQMLTLLANSRAEAEKALREREQVARDEERRYEAEIASVRQAHAGLVADRDRAIARLRAAQARNPVRPASGSSGVSSPEPAGTGLTIPARSLSESDGEFLIQIAADADGLNAQFAICHRYADAMRRHK